MRYSMLQWSQLGRAIYAAQRAQLDVESWKGRADFGLGAFGAWMAIARSQIYAYNLIAWYNLYPDILPI